jgi:hypothetical protein
MISSRSGCPDKGNNPRRDKKANHMPILIFNVVDDE